MKKILLALLLPTSIWAQTQPLPGGGTITTPGSGQTQINSATSGSNINFNGSTLTFTGTPAFGTAVPISGGGTGQTTASGALTALLPSQTGNSGKVLGTNGTSASWVTGGGGGGSPAGSNTQVQYNASGSFGANSGFTSDTSGNVAMASLTTSQINAPASNNSIVLTPTGTQSVFLNGPTIANGNVTPDANNGYNLGSASFVWNTLYTNFITTDSADSVTITPGTGQSVKLVGPTVVTGEVSPATTGTYSLGDSTHIWNSAAVNSLQSASGSTLQFNPGFGHNIILNGTSNINGEFYPGTSGVWSLGDSSYYWSGLYTSLAHIGGLGSSSDLYIYQSGTSPNQMVFNNQSGGGFLFTGIGGNGAWFNGSIFSSADGSYTVGTGSQRFNAAYFSNGVYFGSSSYSTGIFSNGSGSTQGLSYTAGSTGHVFHGNISFSVNGQGLVGNTSGTTPNSGNVGYQLTSNVAVGSAVSLSSGTGANVTTLSLPAGHFRISATVFYTLGAGASVTTYAAAISTGSATLPGNSSGQQSQTVATIASPGTDGNLVVAPHFFNVTGTTTIYLVSAANFSGGTVASYGEIDAEQLP